MLFVVLVNLVRAAMSIKTVLSGQGKTLLSLCIVKALILWSSAKTSPCPGGPQDIDLM